MPTLILNNSSDNGNFKYAYMVLLRNYNDSSLSSSIFSISYQIWICYTTNSSSSSMRMTHQDLYSPYKLNLPITNFLSDDHKPQSLRTLSSFFSHISIPFSMNGLDWLSFKHSEPVPVQSQSELVGCVFEDLRSMGSDLVVQEPEKGNKWVVGVSLALMRTVDLTPDDFDMLHQLSPDNKDRKEGQLASGPACELVKEYRTRDDFSLLGMHEFFFTNKGMALEKEMIDELNEIVLKERVLKKVLTLEEDSEELCSICHEELGDDDDTKYATPCSHLFHQECIMKWITTHNACPMCRFRF